MTEFTPKNEAITFDDFDPYLDRYAYENREKRQRALCFMLSKLCKTIQMYLIQTAN